MDILGKKLQEKVVEDMDRNALLERLFDVFLASVRYSKRYDSSPRSYGTPDVLYSEECHTLELIGKYEGITITEIARRVGKTKSAISQMVDRLIKKGLLEKQPHPENERGVLLKLTPKGEIVFAYHAQYDRDQFDKLCEQLDGFSNRELCTYMEIQKEIIRWLKDKGNR